MINIARLSSVYKFIVLIICLETLGAWFFQGIEEWVFTFICGTLMLIIGYTGHYYSFSAFNLKWFLLYVLATIMTCIGMNINGYISAIISLIPISQIFSLKKQYVGDLLHYLNKALGGLILISLAWYSLYLAGVQLPSFEIVQSTGEKDDFYYSVFYLFTIKTDGDLISLLLPRFQFIFYEPGYFGCVMAILLFLNGYRFDKDHWEDFVFLISLILSLSLAGIGICIFGFIAFTLRYSEHKVRWLLLTGFLSLGFYLFFSNYNQGDNLINNFFFSRFEINDTTGSIAGNTRFSADVSEYFWKHFIHSNDFWFGMRDPSGILVYTNVDYLSYIIRRGFFAFFAFFVFLFYPVMKKGKNRYNKFCLTTIYFLIFMQGSACVFWALYTFLLVLGIGKINNQRDLAANYMLV